VVAAEPGEPADGVVDPLPRHHPAELEDYPLGRVEPDERPRLGPVDGPELRRVEPAGDDGDLPRVGAVEADEVLRVLRALGDDRVGLGRGAVLDRQPLLRERVRAPLVRPADPPQGVERHHERHPLRPL
jgi:hypothetical protein